MALSLSLLGEEAIPLSFSDATVASKEVLKLYQHGLEIELSGHSWDFAKRRAVLAPLDAIWRLYYKLFQGHIYMLRTNLISFAPNGLISRKVERLA
jgi:hypothetical protein